MEHPMGHEIRIYLGSLFMITLGSILLYPCQVPISVFFVILTACDKNKIPSLWGTLITLSQKTKTKVTSLLVVVKLSTHVEMDTSLLIDPTKNVVICEYVQKPGDELKDVNGRVHWTSADGIECNERELQQHDSNIYPIGHQLTSMHPCTRSSFRFNAILFLSCSICIGTVL